VFYVTNRKKKAPELADAAAEERRDSAADVIIVGAGVGGSALAYSLAKVCKVASYFCKNDRNKFSTIYDCFYCFIVEFYCNILVLHNV